MHDHLIPARPGGPVLVDTDPVELTELVTQLADVLDQAASGNDAALLHARREVRSLHRHLDRAVHAANPDAAWTWSIRNAANQLADVAAEAKRMPIELDDPFSTRGARLSASTPELSRGIA